jgi:hypothetical protein
VNSSRANSGAAVTEGHMPGKELKVGKGNPTNNCVGRIIYVTYYSYFLYDKSRSLNFSSTHVVIE